ncbi:MAG: hypothetical protein V4478_03225 [Patescibacteria group bacterium]
MGKGLERTEILRKPCPQCKGHGYVTGQNGVESFCEYCMGSGTLEKEVPYKFDGERSAEEVKEIWEE